MCFLLHGRCLSKARHLRRLLQSSRTRQLDALQSAVQLQERGRRGRQLKKLDRPYRLLNKQ